MRQDTYKKEMFRKWLMLRVIGAAMIFMTILIVVIITSLNESTQVYNEATTKVMPLLSNEKTKMLADLYVRLNVEFEKEIKDLELNYANRLNKRGDKIHYGVNGKENVDEMINYDYVNGIESITYIKGNAKNREDGESNFIDMLTFLSVAFGSDVDRYNEEQLKTLFTNLFHLTHTFTGTSTELYPCEHGCAWCKYYCGDGRCQGEINGNTVGFYKSDLFMGKDGEYGLMYDPFLISKKSNYDALKELAGNERENRTTYQYKVINSRYVESSNGGRTIFEIKNVGDTVVSGDDEIYELMEAEGYCPVCTGGRQTFTNTTRKIAGCISQVECHHGWIEHIDGSDAEDPGYNIFWYMGRDRKNCANSSAEHECTFGGEETTDEEREEHEEQDCKPDDIGCAGYYVCAEGHEHYACPGHIIVCCFGHTNLNLEIRIMYYEEMIDTLKSIVS